MFTEHALIVDVLDAEPKPGWERAHQDVKVKEEGDPGGGLVLRYRSDDGDVDLGVPAGHNQDGRMVRIMRDVIMSYKAGFQMPPEMLP